MTKNRSRLSIFNGGFFIKENSQNYFPFLFLIIILLLVSIRFSFNAESLLKRSIKLENKISSLRLSYINTKSDLMKFYKRSVVEDIVKAQELTTSKNPPYIIDYYE